MTQSIVIGQMTQSVVIGLLCSAWSIIDIYCNIYYVLLYLIYTNCAFDYFQCVTPFYTFYHITNGKKLF